MIICLGFRARVGKDSTADYLVKYHNFEKVVLAEPLKNACRDIFGFSEEQLYGNLKEVIDPYWGITPRQAFQRVGTECMRNHFMDDVWVRSALRKILCSKKNVVVSDCRLKNEIQMGRDIGAFIVRIDRQQAEKITPGADQHVSETQLDNYTKWDHIIKNDGTFFDLYSQIEHMIYIFKLQDNLL